MSPTNNLPSIKNYTFEELKNCLVQTYKQPAFRAKQLWQWLYQKQATSWDEMTSLPDALRAQLKKDYSVMALTEVEHLTADDQTRKTLWQLADNETIESVRILSPKHSTLCISTQVGCPVRCTFCASGRDGLIRNLTVAEIVDQVILANLSLGRRIDNIVVMGMGEPLLNLDNLIAALTIICSPDGLGFSSRNVTISTSGIVPGIIKLADRKVQWNLAFSLHATTEEERAKLIPPNQRYPLSEILEACTYFFQQTGRIVTLEYALIAGKNDATETMNQLADIAETLKAKINIIPYNHTTDAYRQPDNSWIKRCISILERRHIPVTIRREKGSQINAACGQLRRRHKEQH